MATMIEQFVDMRRVSTPLIQINGPDPAQTIRAIRKQYTDPIDGKAQAPIPLIQWDCTTGFSGINDVGKAIIATMDKNEAAKADKAREPLSEIRNPSDAMLRVKDFPGLVKGEREGSMIFMLNLHRFYDEPTVVQGLSNLRDLFPKNRRTLVILCPSSRLPAELVQDVAVLTDPLPDDAALTTTVRQQYANVKVVPTDEAVEQAVDAVRGLATFPAEQAVAMSIKTTGLDFPNLWTRKRYAIEQTKGLKIFRDPMTFDDQGGMAQIQRFGLSICYGPRRPRLVVVIDEIEKKMAGATGPVGDNTGTSQDALAVTLEEMENNDYLGIILVGAPGTGKTQFAKALGNSVCQPAIVDRLLGVPELTKEAQTRAAIMTGGLDYGAAKGGIVGDSERLIRGVMETILAVAGKGGALFVATCNGLDKLPPELRRRFRLGIWYCDLPTRDEKDAIWPINLKRYGLDPGQARPADEHWTGSDIRNCCEMAWLLRSSLVQAAAFVVPVAKSDASGLERLRGMADGRFLSTSYPGTYIKAGKNDADDAMAEGQRIID